MDKDIKVVDKQAPETKEMPLEAIVEQKETPKNKVKICPVILYHGTDLMYQFDEMVFIEKNCALYNAKRVDVEYTGELGKPNFKILNVRKAV